jgi:hypothetical protein
MRFFERSGFLEPRAFANDPGFATDAGFANDAILRERGDRGRRYNGTQSAFADTNGCIIARGRRSAIG